MNNMMNDIRELVNTHDIILTVADPNWWVVEIRNYNAKVDHMVKEVRRACNHVVVNKWHETECHFTGWTMVIG